MIAFDIGNLGFNIQTSEQTLLLVIASKDEAEGIPDFFDKALDYLEEDADSDWCDAWNEIYKERKFIPASEQHLEWADKIIKGMNERITIHLEKNSNAMEMESMDPFELILCFESKHFYTLFLWATSA